MRCPRASLVVTARRYDGVPSCFFAKNIIFFIEKFVCHLKTMQKNGILYIGNVFVLQHAVR